MTMRPADQIDLTLAQEADRLFSAPVPLPQRQEEDWEEAEDGGQIRYFR